MRTDIFEVYPLDEFRKRAERLTKKKRFLSLPGQIEGLFDAFRKGEFDGERIKHAEHPFAYDVYKLRMPNPDADAGKSNGYRVIYLVVTDLRLVVFLTIYYKKEEADAPDQYISGLIDGCILDMLPDEDDPPAV
jgi:mRNA-degrading endonuclease RelE of RelBE toxin-antitoxin system